MAQVSTDRSNRPDRFPVASGIEAVSAAAASLSSEQALQDRTPAVEVRGFSFSYVEGKPILDQVDWTVEAGSFILFVGGTGTGKTTLIRHMKPEIAPKGIRSGSIRIFGIPVEELDARASAELVGYVSQSPENQIVCDTVWHELAFGLENLGIPQETMHRRVAEVAHFFGIEPWLDRSTDALSGGQKQLMTLASVLALRPRLLLLDEPTSQLDPVAAKNFLHALFRINRELGLTVVMVTHDPEMVADYATSLRELRDMRIKEHDIEEYRQKIRCLAASVDYTRAAPPLVEGYGQLEPVVSLRDTHVRYGKDQPFVLRGCDLQVKAGTIHALVGGNGSGKTTLLNTVAGTMKVDRGRVQNLLKGSQALLPQNPKTIFVRDSVAEELAEWQASAGYTEEDIQEVLERFHLTPLVDQHPYDLSGGQQQALAFAKIALTKPKLLLMDEPTKGLDVVYRFLVADNLMELKRQGVTIVMVTHDLSFAARVSDVTSLLFDGQVTCTQPTGEFFQENLFYRPTIDAFFCTWERDWETEGDA